MTWRDVVLVVGPPGSGKSTFAAHSGLLHLEREQFGSERSYREAVRRACAPADARVVVVRACQTLEEQREWERLTGATQVVVLDVDYRECVRRIRRRGNRNWRGEARAAWLWHRARADGEIPLPKRSSTVAVADYGKKHRRRRKELEPFVASGLAVCWRCGNRIAAGEKWHLGHDDFDKTVYRGPEHVRCNTAAPSLLRSRIWSREWL